MNPEVMTEDTAETVETTETATETTAALTQADVDRIVKDRLVRERAKFADYDELKTKALKWAEVEESQKSEVQKAREAAQTAIAQADTLRARIRQQAVVTAAIKGGAVNPEQVAALVGIDDIEDSEDSTAIGERVTAFLSENSHFLRADRPTVAAVSGNAKAAERSSFNLDEIALMDPRELAKNPELLAAVISARNNA